MRILLACVGTLFLVLGGCNMVIRMATLIVFSDHPLFVKASAVGTTKDDLLAIAPPRRINALGEGAAQCFDYKLVSKSKKRNFYVAFTDIGRVSAYGFSSCARALGAGELEG